MPYHKPECDKPGCTDRGKRRYQDGNGNSLRLCNRHYYRLIADSVDGVNIQPGVLPDAAGSDIV